LWLKKWERRLLSQIAFTAVSLTLGHSPDPKLSVQLVALLAVQLVAGVWSSRLEFPTPGRGRAALECAFWSLTFS